MGKYKAVKNKGEHSFTVKRQQETVKDQHENCEGFPTRPLIYTTIERVLIIYSNIRSPFTKAADTAPERNGDVMTEAFDTRIIKATVIVAEPTKRET